MHAAVCIRLRGCHTWSSEGRRRGRRRCLKNASLQYKWSSSSKHNTCSYQSLGDTWRSKEEEEDPEDTEMPDPSSLTDEDLRTMLLKYGVKAGPIVGSTRALYERKLAKLLQSHGHEGLNGAEKAVLYSDSEEEEESGSEQQEAVEQSAQQESSQEPVKDILKDLFPDTKSTPTGIYATCRRPIKGAAQRPIQYTYPDTPVSPMTLERREVERRLVPIQIQIFVFLIVACIVYFVFVNVEDGSFVLSLLDSLSQGSDSKEGFLIQAETQDTQAVNE